MRSTKVKGEIQKIGKGRLFLYAFLCMFLFLGIGYLLNQIFPSFFGNISLIRQGTIQIDNNPIDTEQAAIAYVSQMCGTDCGVCSRSFNRCTSLLEKQVGIICVKGSKQQEICFYDLEKLTLACKMICA